MEKIGGQHILTTMRDKRNINKVSDFRPWWSYVRREGTFFTLSGSIVYTTVSPGWRTPKLGS